MKIRLLLFFCLIVVTSVCFAQNVVTRNSSQSTSRNLENQTKPAITSGRAIVADMKTYNPGMYWRYQSGKKMQRTGIIMTGAGGGVAMIGAILSIIPDGGRAEITIGGVPVAETRGDNSGLRKAGTVMLVTGTVSLSIGLPVMIVGGKKKKQTFQDFMYQHYYSQQSSSYFQMNVYPNRAGIAYVF